MIISDSSNIRIDTYLADYLSLSRSKIQKLIKNKLVTVNGKIVSANYIVKEILNQKISL